MEFSEKLKGFLIKPAETFNASKEDTINDAWIYYVSIVVISCMITLFKLILISNSKGGEENFILSIMIPAALFVYSIFANGEILVWTFLTGALLHIGIYLLGGKKGIVQTIKALMYGSTPGVLSSFILPGPLFLKGIWGNEYMFFIYSINLIMWMWSTILVTIGLSSFQEISIKKAAVAGVVWIIIFSLLARTASKFLIPLWSF